MYPKDIIQVKAEHLPVVRSVTKSKSSLYKITLVTHVRANWKANNYIKCNENILEFMRTSLIHSWTFTCSMLGITRCTTSRPGRMSVTQNRRSSESCVASIARVRKGFYQWLAQKPTIRMGGDTWDQQMGPNMTNLGQKDM